MSMLYTVRRAASSSILPEASRALNPHGFFHSALRSAFQNCCIYSALGAAFQNRCRKEIMKGTPWVSRREFTSESEVYTKSNENLVKMIKDEIPSRLIFWPGSWDLEDVPSMIEGKKAVILRRDKYGNEDIKVEATLVEDGKEDVSITVTISKGEGPILQFDCIGYYYGFQIEGVALKHPQNKASYEGDGIPYDGRDFRDLDESLLKALHEYLEVRGINLGLRNYLSVHLLREGNKYTEWLKAVKEYLEK